MSVDILPTIPVHLGHSKDGKGAQGAEAIAKTFGVHRVTVMRWKKAGAPIVLVGRKYQCRYDELWTWIGRNEKRLYRETEKG